MSMKHDPDEIKVASLDSELTSKPGCTSEKHIEEQETVVALINDPPIVPDGGWRAWMAVTGSSLTLFASFGVVNSYGVFESYYKDHRLTNQSQSVVALIGATQLCLVYSLGPLFGKIFDSYGSKLLLPIGTSCIVAGHLLLSFCQHDKVYQYFLTQSLLLGIGSSMVITPALAIMRHFFQKKLGLAFGLVLSGSSLGGILLPMVYQRLFPIIGFNWTVRVIGLICFACLSSACLTLKTRLPFKPTKKREVLMFLDLGGFKDPRYCCLAASLLFTLYGLFIPFFYIKQYAELRGMPPKLSQSLISIISATTLVSRLVPGFLADKVGPLNLMVPMTIISGLLTSSLALPTSGNAPIIAYAVLYGLFAGGVMALLPSYLANITPQPIYGARMGTIYMFIAVATLAGTPTGGAIVGQGHEKNYRNVFGFAGIMLTIGGLLALSAWSFEARRVFRTLPKSALSWRSFCF